MKRYAISEIFCSIQGEGVHTGRLVTFIRFAGCNLACPWCDTNHTVKQQMTIGEIVDAVKALPAFIVVLTGGEPALQIEGGFISALAFAGYPTHLETNGTVDIRSLVHFIDWITVAPKAGTKIAIPSGCIDEVKVVLDGVINPEDYAYPDEELERFIAPCWTECPAYKLNGTLSFDAWKNNYAEARDANSNAIGRAVAYVKEHPHWRLGLQTHKLIGIR